LISVKVLSRKIIDIAARNLAIPWRTSMRKRSFGILVALLTTIVLTPSAGYSQEAQGRTWYFNYCASCHGESGRGDGRVAKYLIPKPADLTKLSEANGGRFPAERIFEIIDGRREVEVHGSREMPVWGRTTRLSLATVQARIRAIVDYLATLQGK
jgi:mono/diheme cytochrome c family protein